MLLILLLRLIIRPFACPPLLSFWFRIVPIVIRFRLHSRDRFSARFVIDVRFDSLLSSTSVGIIRFELFSAGRFALCPMVSPNFHLGLGSLVHDSPFDFVLRPIVDRSCALDSLPRVIRFGPSSLQFRWALLALLARSEGKRTANHC